MSFIVCSKCKWWDWHIAVDGGTAKFVDECPYQPLLAGKVTRAGDCDDFDYKDEKIASMEKN